MKESLGLLKKLLPVCCISILVFSCSAPEEKTSERTAVPAAKMYTVVIKEMKFAPADLTVNPGDTVTWINNDIVEHNITETGKKAWSSSGLPPGKSWSMVVQKNADYFCSIHPVMKGSLHAR
jgi:plastocyanin